jgi:nicotinamidase-related amidase
LAGHFHWTGLLNMNHPTQMSTSDTALLVIDVQEKLMPKIRSAAAVELNIAFLLDAAALLGVPAEATEQYPKGLGSTVAKIRQLLLGDKQSAIPDKVAFSSCAVPEVVERFRREARTRIVLAGIESHVCVLHTALDLLALRFRVYVAVDAIGSRYALDHEVALRRMEQAGCIPITSEMCVFEWLGGSHHPQFKAVSQLVQSRMKSVEPA